MKRSRQAGRAPGPSVCPALLTSPWRASCTWASHLSDSNRSWLELSLQQAERPAFQLTLFCPCKSYALKPLAQPCGFARSLGLEWRCCLYRTPVIGLQAKSARILPSGTQVLGRTRLPSDGIERPC